MTQNQLAYQANLEKERANRAQEDLKAQEVGVKRGELDTERAKVNIEGLKTQGQLARWVNQSQIEAAQTGLNTLGGLGNLLKGISSVAALAI